VLPEIADRRPRDRWIADGGRDTHSRALAKAQQILNCDKLALLSSEVDAVIRRRLQIDF
jgi:trimethylamine:corrinoid methyltransferase-like protein